MQKVLYIEIHQNLSKVSTVIRLSHAENSFGFQQKKQKNKKQKKLIIIINLISSYFLSK